MRLHVLPAAKEPSEIPRLHRSASEYYLPVKRQEFGRVRSLRDRLTSSVSSSSLMSPLSRRFALFLMSQVARYSIGSAGLTADTSDSAKARQEPTASCKYSASITMSPRQQLVQLILRAKNREKDTMKIMNISFPFFCCLQCSDNYLLLFYQKCSYNPTSKDTLYTKVSDVESHLTFVAGTCDI